MRRSATLFLVVLAAVPLVIGAARRRAVNRPMALEMRRSFAVTDLAILDGFSFERVMNAIVERGRIPGVTARQLYQQWFDTQNPKPGLVVADAPHCDDFLVDGKPSFNAFPRRCPTPEGSFATGDPFVSPPAFIPLALINRFDMTAADGSHCGQYRLIFARRGRPRDVLHLIFEAVLPNPSPTKELAACRPVAQFWADLSGIDSISERRARLEMFFFTGLPGFAPVVHPDHLSRASGGGIRSFHYTASAGGRPQFYQFRLENLVMQPDVLQNTPMGRLFDSRVDTDQARRFRDAFIQQVATLAIPDPNRFFMDLAGEFLMAESDPLDSEPAFLFIPAFTSGLVSPRGRQFHDSIASELARVGSSLRPTDIVYRAQTQSCYGCHANTISGPLLALTPPLPTAFLQHISETAQEEGEAGPRYAISRAMRDVFLPHRMDVLRRFLISGTPPLRTNATGTIGGGRTVQ